MGNPERAGEAGRICLAHLPALRRIRRAAARPRCATTMCRAARSAGNSAPICCSRPIRASRMLPAARAPAPSSRSVEQLYASSANGVELPVDAAEQRQQLGSLPPEQAVGRWSGRPGSTSSSASAACREAHIEPCLADTQAARAARRDHQARRPRRRASPARRPSSSMASGRGCRQLGAARAAAARGDRRLT